MDSTNVLIRDIYQLKAQKEVLTNEINQKRNILAELEADIEKKSAELLSNLKQENSSYVETDELVAAKFSKSSVEYSNDYEAICTLKSNGYENLIKTKTVDSLDKTAIKKAIKADSNLKELIEKLTTEKVTEYVVVTSIDNYQKMLGHIDNAK